MPQISIRKARQEDAEAVVACIAAAYAAVRQELPDMPDVTAGVPEDIAAERVVLAEAGVDLVGVVVFDHASAATMVNNLAVAPAAQGQGVARLLLGHAEDAARQSGSERMDLRTHRLMQRVRELYRRLGWAETGVAGNTVSMTKPL